MIKELNITQHFYERCEERNVDLNEAIYQTLKGNKKKSRLTVITYVENDVLTLITVYKKRKEKKHRQDRTTTRLKCIWLKKQREKLKIKSYYE